jgi:hypothetical protein
MREHGSASDHSGKIRWQHGVDATTAVMTKRDVGVVVSAMISPYLISRRAIATLSTSKELP